MNRADHFSRLCFKWEKHGLTVRTMTRSLPEGGRAAPLIFSIGLIAIFSSDGRHNVVLYATLTFVCVQFSNGNLSQGQISVQIEVMPVPHLPEFMHLIL